MPLRPAILVTLILDSVIMDVCSDSTVCGNTTVVLALLHTGCLVVVALGSTFLPHRVASLLALVQSLGVSSYVWGTAYTVALPRD
jgi:hypothetical protein